MKPMREMLHVPANPSGQRPILIILVHRREVPPLRIAADNFGHAGFEINSKPFPQEQEDTGADRRVRCPQARPKTPRCEKQCNESGLKQHSIGLISRKLPCSADKRKKTK